MAPVISIPITTYVAHIPTYVAHIGAHADFVFLISMFRTLLNGWITSWRFGGAFSPCRLRCGSEGAQDKQSHYLVCSSMMAAVSHTFDRLAQIFVRLDLIDILLLNFSGGTEQCRFHDAQNCTPCKVCLAAFVNHVLVLSMNQLRHQYRHDDIAFSSRLLANASWLASRGRWARLCLRALRR